MHAHNPCGVCSACMLLQLARARLGGSRKQSAGLLGKGQFVQARAELEREREEGAKLQEHIFQLERAEAKEASR